VFTCPNNGLGDNITAYLKANFQEGGGFVKCAIYKHADSTLVPNGTTEELEIGEGQTGWFTFNFGATKPELTAGTEYVLVVWGIPTAMGGVTITYDDGEGTTQGHYQDLAYDSGYWPNPASFSHEDRKYSIYCSYTPSAPPFWVIRIRERWSKRLKHQESHYWPGIHMSEFWNS